MFEFIGLLSYLKLDDKTVDMLRTDRMYGKLEAQMGKKLDDPSVQAAAQRQAARLYERLAKAKARKQNR